MIDISKEFSSYKPCYSEDDDIPLTESQTREVHLYYYHNIFYHTHYILCHLIDQLTLDEIYEPVQEVINSKVKDVSYTKRFIEVDPEYFRYSLMIAFRDEVISSSKLSSLKKSVETKFRELGFTVVNYRPPGTA